MRAHPTEDRKKQILALLSLLALAASGCAGRAFHFARQYFAGPNPVEECSETGSARVCRYHPKKGQEDADAALFFLHYAGGDERSFARIGLAQAFYAEYRRRGKKPPRVWALSYGENWLLSSKLGRQVVLREHFEKIARDLAGEATRRRYAWGMSQGGYNAAQAAFGLPDWTAAALSCPAVHIVSPFRAEEEAPLRERTHGTVQEVGDGFKLFNLRLAGADVWADENPIAMVRRSGALPPVFIETNTKDEFGFQEGARELAKVLKESGHRVDFRETAGGHCVVSGKAVADFLIDLP